MSHPATLRNPPMSRSPGSMVARLYSGLGMLAPVADLLVRLWVANAFFKSGLSKIQNFDTTVFLFAYEYRVPLLSPTVAAYLGTATELFFPVLLALGLAGRASAGVLFVFNIVAVLSYPAISFSTALDHQAWALLLLITLLHGPGKLSLDHLIGRGFSRWPQ